MTDTYLLPAVAPAPLEGLDLNDFLQAVVVGITGLPGNMVRPRWQPEPASIPAAGTAWAAMGITERPADIFPFVGQDEDGAILQRHEELSVLHSFYDLGTNGQADAYASLLRDGLAIPENREVLTRAGMGLVSVGEVLAVPSLLKSRWLYRVDLLVVIRREVLRRYAVPTVLSAQGTLQTDQGYNQPIIVNAPVP